MAGSDTRRTMRMRRMEAEGLSQRAIADAFGISQGRVAEILSRTRRPGLTGAARDARDAEMVARVDAGEPLGDVAAAFGLSPYTARHKIGEWRRAQKVPARPLPVATSGPVVVRPARLVPTRVIGWGEFGPDVEARDAAVAAADARPFRGGRYPRSPRVVCSGMGSPALACAEFGRGMA